MEKIALYRKYRPQNFEQIVGQKAIVTTLSNIVSSQRINHAYIFAGHKGSGKTSLAKIFAKAINCITPVNGNPCNECINCKIITNNETTDILELDAASNNGVDEMRSIISAISYLPNQLKYKIYIIDEAHMLTSNSWNAMLKTLEEPPSHVILIFATTEYHKIPATIISRCQRYDFAKIERKLLKQLIVTIAASENIKINTEATDALALLANGSARDALSILDQMNSYTHGDINVDALNQMFGIVSVNNKIKLLNSLIMSDLNTVLSQIYEFNQQGVNFNVLLADLLDILMDKIIFLQTGNINLMTILDNDTIPLIESKDIDGMLHLIKIFNENLIALKNSSNPKFLFEYVLMQAITSDKLVVKNTDDKSFNPKMQKPSIVEQPNVNTAGAFEPQATTMQSVAEISQDLNKVEIEDHLFSTKALQFPSIDTPSIPVMPKSVELYSQEYAQNFFSIAYNRQKDLKQAFDAKLTKLKGLTSLYSPNINIFLNCICFLLVSPNGAIVLFDNEAYVSRFMKIHQSEEFIKFYTQEFGTPQLVLAITNVKAKEFKQQFQNLKEIQYQDVKIIENSVDTTKTRLLEILAKPNEGEKNGL